MKNQNAVSAAIPLSHAERLTESRDEILFPDMTRGSMQVPS
jgi:hypothetical protein